VVSLLAARAVVFDYPGPLRALDGVDLELAACELVAVIGPNGSGKSTLLRCLSGLAEPGAGRVELHGRPIQGFRDRERARLLAMVPQFLPALPDVSVANFVLGGRYAHLSRWRGASARDRRFVALALEAADAAELAERLMSELSGGQRQRVLVARALAQEAEVLLVDEPTSSLDPEHQIRVFELIARTAAAERGAVVVTHELNLASQFATRIVLLDGGRVAARGTPREVLRREVLEPVYGERLHFGSVGTGEQERPIVVPWRG